MKVIDLGSEEDFNQMISQLISANSSISSTDKTDVEWAITHTEDVSCFLPNVIPHKENMSFIIGVLLINRKISADLSLQSILKQQLMFFALQLLYLKAM